MTIPLAVAGVGKARVVLGPPEGATAEKANAVAGCPSSDCVRQTLAGALSDSRFKERITNVCCGARLIAERRACRESGLQTVASQFAASAAVISACLAVVPWPPTIVAPVMPSLRITSPTATVAGDRLIGPRGEIRSVT